MALNTGIFWALFQSRFVLLFYYVTKQIIPTIQHADISFLSWAVLLFKLIPTPSLFTSHFAIASLLFGNLFVHFEFSGPTIDKHTRLIVYAVLTGTGVLGTLLMIAMRKPMSDRDSNIQRWVLVSYEQSQLACSGCMVWGCVTAQKNQKVQACLRGGRC